MKQGLSPERRRVRRRYIVGYSGDRNRRVIRDRLSAFRYAKKLAGWDGFDTMLYDCNLKRFVKVYNKFPLRMRGELLKSYLSKRYGKRIRHESILSRGRQIAIFGYSTWECRYETA